MKTIGSHFGICAEVPAGRSDETDVTLRTRSARHGGFNCTVSSDGEIKIVADYQKLCELARVVGAAIKQLEKQDAEATAVIPMADIQRTALENANAQVVS